MSKPITPIIGTDPADTQTLRFIGAAAGVAFASAALLGVVTRVVHAATLRVMARSNQTILCSIS